MIMDLVDRVAEFVARETGTSRGSIATGTIMEDDLGCTGMDAAALMDAFAREFNVDMEGFRFESHFGPEGSGPELLILLPLVLLARLLGFRWLESSSPEPISVGHLAAVASRGKWFRPEVERGH